MRLALLLATSILLVPPAGAAAQTPPGSAPSTSAPVAATQVVPGTAAAEVKPGELPVSLSRIRSELRKEVRNSLLRQYDVPVDFRVHVLEQQKIDDLLSKLDFKTGQGPPPPGGIYGYEQQRRLFNPVDRPLAQPYAAFSPGEFFTIALQSIIGNYLGGKAIQALKDANRARAERTARDQVAFEIAAYCATRPDRADIALCALPYDR